MEKICEDLKKKDSQICELKHGKLYCVLMWSVRHFLECAVVKFHFLRIVDSLWSCSIPKESCPRDSLGLSIENHNVGLPLGRSLVRVVSGKNLFLLLYLIQRNRLM